MLHRQRGRARSVTAAARIKFHKHLGPGIASEWGLGAQAVERVVGLLRGDAPCVRSAANFTQIGLKKSNPPRVV